MAIHNYHCKICDKHAELFRWNTEDNPKCCDVVMEKLFSPFAFVKMKGEGGYPARRKFFKGTACGTTRNSREWTPENPQPLDAPSLNSYPEKEKIQFTT